MLNPFKRIFLLVFVLIVGAIEYAHAQGVPIYNCYGGDGNDAFQDACQALDGNFLFVGYTNSTNLTNLPPKTDSRADAWIRKLDRNLKPISDNFSFKGSGDDKFKRVLLTDDGGYLILGNSDSNDEDLPDKYQLNDVWLLKLDKNFNVQWSEVYGGDLNDFASDIVRSTDTIEESYIITALTESVNGDIAEFENHGKTDLLVFKVSANNGSIKWLKCIGGTGDEALPGLITSIGNNQYNISVVSRSGDGDFSSININGESDAVICFVEDKIDSLYINKVYSFGGSKEEKVSYAFSNELATAFFTSTASSDFDVTSNHSIDATDGWLLNFNNDDGSIQNSWNFGGTKEEEISDVKKISDGSYLALFNSRSSDGDLTTVNNGDFDLWLVRLDKDFQLIEQSSYGGSGIEEAHRIVPICDGGYFILSASTSTDIPNRAGGLADAFLISFPGRTTTIDPGNEEICKGELVSLTTTSNPPGDVFWYDKLIGGNLIRTAPDFPLDTLTKTRSLYFSSAPNCLVHDSVVVKVVSFNAAIKESGKRKFCDGNAPLGLQAVDENPEADYLWSTTETANFIEAKETGDYYLTISKNGDCAKTSDVISVVKMAKPIARAGILGPNLISESVSFKDNSSADVVSWYWNFGDEENSTEQNPTHVFKRSGEIYVSMQVTNTDSCVDVWDTLYTVYPGLEFCNVFTPNGDGKNDFFEVKHLKSPLEGAHLLVYSRWGEAIYESKDYDNSWDAANVPAGTYFFIFKLGRRYEKQGTVTVIK